MPHRTTSPLPVPLGNGVVFRPDDDFGIVPNFAPTPVPPAPELSGPPDPLATLRDALAAIEAEALLALRTAPSTRAGQSRVARLTALLEDVAARSTKLSERRRVPLVPLPTTTLLALPDLLPAVRSARRAVAALLADRAATESLHALGYARPGQAP